MSDHRSDGWGNYDGEFEPKPDPEAEEYIARLERRLHTLKVRRQATDWENALGDLDADSLNDSRDIPNASALDDKWWLSCRSCCCC
jgi:hypothetical protein